MTVSEAADWLRISPHTLREWTRRKKIHAVRFGSRFIRFEMESLRQWALMHRSFKRGGL